MIDYDLVIIGGTTAGRYAALTATGFQARVALVEPFSNSQDLPNLGQEAIALSSQYNQILSESSRFAEQISSQKFGVHWATTNSEMPIELRFDGVMKWAEGVVANLSEINSLGVLATRGVDVICGDGEFVLKPDLAFAVNGRKLRSLSYLLACPSLPAIPNIEGLSSVGYFTSETVWKFLKPFDLI